MSRRKIPIPLWESLSEKARSRDSYFKSCGHCFYQTPYSIAYLISSKVSLKCAEGCTAEFCEALDQYHCEKDFLYMSKLAPPPVLPVNKLGAVVLDREGKMKGPYTPQGVNQSMDCWSILALRIS